MLYWNRFIRQAADGGYVIVTLDLRLKAEEERRRRRKRLNNVYDPKNPQQPWADDEDDEDGNGNVGKWGGGSSNDKEVGAVRWRRRWKRITQNDLFPTLSKVVWN